MADLGDQLGRRLPAGPERRRVGRREDREDDERQRADDDEHERAPEDAAHDVAQHRRRERRRRSRRRSRSSPGRAARGEEALVSSVADVALLRARHGHERHVGGAAVPQLRRGRDARREERREVLPDPRDRGRGLRDHLGRSCPTRPSGPAGRRASSACAIAALILGSFSSGQFELLTGVILFSRERDVEHRSAARGSPAASPRSGRCSARSSERCSTSCTSSRA